MNYFAKTAAAKILYTLFFLFSSCNRDSVVEYRKWQESNDKIKVLATVAMIGDLAKEIVGDQGDVLTLIQGDLDPHSYQLVKGDSEKFQRADIIFAVGVGLEHGAGFLAALQSTPKTVFVGEKIWEAFPLKRIHYKGQRDPHLWQDISLWSESIQDLVAALSKIRPEKTDYFKENGIRLRKKLLTLHAEIWQKLQTIPSEIRRIVTSHDAFNYFARAYLATPEEASSENGWRNRAVAPQGLAPESQISSKDLLEVIDYIFHYKVKVVFFESNVSKEALSKIEAVLAEKNWNIQIAKEPLFGDSVGSSKNGGGSYLEMVHHNGLLIYQELSRP